MKIGIFDSGLGGLFILKSIVKKLSQYSYIYLGDTKRVPYGNRSPQTIYEFTEEAVNYLFKNNCQLIILACNAASSQALRKIQRQYLPLHYYNKRVLGVIVPTVEEVLNNPIKKVGILATQATVNSKVYIKELKKINPKIKVFQSPAPLLVPLVENDGLKWSEPILKEYLKPLLDKDVDVIILGCTHYPILKKNIKKIIGNNIKLLSQDEIIPKKLVDYLILHPEIENKLEKKSQITFYVTDLTPNFQKIARKWFGKKINLKLLSF